MSSIVYGNAADAQARLPQPGKGHPIDAEGRVVVHHHGRGVQAAAAPQRRIQVAGEDGRLEGVGQRIGPGDRLVEARRTSTRRPPGQTPRRSSRGRRPAGRRARSGRSNWPRSPGRRTSAPLRARPPPAPTRPRVALRAGGSAGRPRFPAASDRPPSMPLANRGQALGQRSGDLPVGKDPLHRHADLPGMIETALDQAAAGRSPDRRRRPRSPAPRRHAPARSACPGPAAPRSAQPTLPLPTKLKKPTRRSATMSSAS